MIYEIYFLIALIFTIFIETLVLYFIIRKVFYYDSKKIPGELLIFTGTLCSFSTLPYLWFILPNFIQGISYIIAGEIGVFLIEGLTIKFLLRINLRNAFILSFICNLVSFSFGLILF